MVSEKVCVCVLLMLYLGKPLKAGQVILCLILPGANSRSVPVTINPEEVYSALVHVLYFVQLCACLCLSHAMMAANS